MGWAEATENLVRAGAEPDSLRFQRDSGDAYWFSSRKKFSVPEVIFRYLQLPRTHEQPQVLGTLQDR